MDKYSISQTPAGKGSKNRQIGNKVNRTKAAKRQSRSLNPQLVLGGLVLIAVLVLAGLVWMRFFVGSPQAASGNNSGQKTNKTTPVTASKRDAVTAAVDNKQPTGLNHYYAAQVRVIMPGYNKLLSAADVAKIISNPLNSAQTPWNWHVPPGDLSNWQTGPYGDNFTGNVVVGISNDGTVISIGFDNDGNIDTIFIAPAGDLAPTTPGGDTTTNPGATPGNGTTPDTTPNPATSPGSPPFSD